MAEEIAARETEALAEGVLGGDRRALARAITLIESTRGDHRVAASQLLERLMPHAERIIASGSRAEELALRFKYGGYDTERIEVSSDKLRRDLPPPHDAGTIPYKHVRDFFNCVKTRSKPRATLTNVSPFIQL